MAKITWPNRTDIKAAIGATYEWAASIANEVKTSVNALYDQKLDKLSAAAQDVTSNVEFLGNVLADKLAANEGAIGSGFKILTPPDDGAIIEGMVGIGLTNPGQKVDIDATGTGGVRISSDASAALFFRSGFNGVARFRYTNNGGTNNLFRLRDDDLAKDVLNINQFGNVGVERTIMGAKFDVLQSDDAAGIPVLKLEQADLSEPMIKFDATIGVGNPIEAIGAKSFTQTHFLKINVEGLGVKYMPIGDLA